MKTFSMGVAFLLLAAGTQSMLGCAAEEDDSDASGAAVSGSVGKDGGTDCQSVRDGKAYVVGTKLKGRHDQLRCPTGTKLCLAPDDDYESTCQDDGSWDVVHTGFVIGGAL